MAMRTTGRIHRYGALASALALGGCRTACACPSSPRAPSVGSPGESPVLAATRPAERNASDASAASRDAEPRPQAGPTRKPDNDASLREHFEGAKVLSVMHGKAAYYADKFTGRKTASGERYDPKRPTAAHRRLPFGSIVRVTRKQGGQDTFVRINDRGPYGGSRRIIDLAKVAAEQLEMTRVGVADVRVEVLRLGEGEGSP